LLVSFLECFDAVGWGRKVISAAISGHNHSSNDQVSVDYLAQSHVACRVPANYTRPFVLDYPRACRYQKGKTNLDFTEARDSEWQWHQLDHMQVYTSLQTDNHASTTPLIFTGRMPFLPPNQQHQSTVVLDALLEMSLLCVMCRYPGCNVRLC